jgi:D-alanyl-D-alanine carboxypeptidase
MTQPKTQEEIVSMISKGRIEFEPGKDFSYSNSNYILLGYIIEKISKKSYSANLKDRITSKIGLSNTYYGGKINTKNNECFSYQFINKWELAPETDMSIPGGAGSVVSTSSDLTMYIEALFSEKLISKNSLTQMKTMTNGYGFGMIQFPFYEKKAFGHTGGIDGFISNLAYFHEDSLAVAYITNGQVYPMNDILIGVLSACFNKTYSIPTFKTVALSAEILDKYLGVYGSTQLPLKITITKDKSSLVAQATGQSSFTLEAIEENKFKFDPAGIKMEFNPEKKELILKQGGGNFLFTLDK